ncbi:hypothetical protein B0H15DRAFT_950202 [Mycena belliarum]|uniref:Uncharacterized protein n=1 Tax=Mycena belliarum TaxID=1033014 RepID=A0AAD6U4B3_9AGAR|nr:hypothetical protein B0H15DRAFT_950202 [Mycena belliae]
MPTKRELSLQRFPLRRPVDEPPPRYETLLDGHRTPLYVLAWVCPSQKLYDNLEKGLPPGTTVHYRNFRDFISMNWIGDFPYELTPLPLCAGGNYYLIAMFNKKSSNHLRRIRNRDNDPLIQAARVAFGVVNDPSLEATLQWFRFPLGWVEMEATLKYNREMDARLAAMQKNESMDKGLHDADDNTAPESMV